MALTPEFKADHSFKTNKKNKQSSRKNNEVAAKKDRKSEMHKMFTSVAFLKMGDTKMND